MTLAFTRTLPMRVLAVVLIVAEIALIVALVYGFTVQAQPQPIVIPLRFGGGVC